MPKIKQYFPLPSHGDYILHHSLKKDKQTMYCPSLLKSKPNSISNRLDLVAPFCSITMYSFYASYKFCLIQFFTRHLGKGKFRIYTFFLHRVRWEVLLNIYILNSHVTKWLGFRLEGNEFELPSRSLSDYHTRERYRSFYPPSYRLSSITTFYL